MIVRRLLTVAVLAALAGPIGGCGGRSGDDGGGVEDRLRREGGVALVYGSAVPSPDPADLREAVAVLRRRASRLGDVRAVETPTGVELRVAGVSSFAETGLPRHVVSVAFYDWEANVIGPGGKPDPGSARVTGGSAAGSPLASVSLFDAVRRAEARPVVEDEDDLWPAPEFYAVSRPARTATGPFDVRGEAARAARARGGRVATVGPGTAIVRAEQPRELSASQKGDEWYVLDDDVALSGRDITNPEQTFAEGPGGSGQPVVAFDFTGEGGEAFERLTRQVAQRGQARRLPGADAAETAQHFTIVVDDEIIATPFVDPAEHPDGIDAANGSQIQGNTVRAAQDLANVLEAGPVPVPLRLVAERRIPPGG